ncbi:M56 family metallopeptidase [Christensenellaceae bacterium OttesenSCG-928-K19]|nr:M56 family metallopeptidase [Christensenellaceae bacterium OttesenSCG-928-K19]
MEQFLSMLLESTLSMSVVTLALFAVSAVWGRRYSAKGLYYMWIACLTGFLLPFRPDFSAPVRLPAPNLTRTVSIVLQASVQSIVVQDVQSASPQSVELSVANILFIVWITGLAIFIGWQLFRHIRFVRATQRWSTCVQDSATLALFAQCRQRLGIQKNLPLKECPLLQSPMLVGLLRPIVLLPARDYPQLELEHILLHELVHYKRRDLWLRVLMLAARAFQWFNPLAHVAARAAGLQCELSCDEAVLSGTGRRERQAYGQAILAATNVKSSVRTAFSADFHTSYGSTKKRLLAMLDMDKKRKGRLAACVVATVVVCAGLLIGCAQEADEVTAAHSAEKAHAPAVATMGQEESPIHSVGEQSGAIADSVTEESFVASHPAGAPATTLSPVVIEESRAYFNIGGYNFVQYDVERFFEQYEEMLAQHDRSFADTMSDGGAVQTALRLAEGASDTMAYGIRFTKELQDGQRAAVDTIFRIEWNVPGTQDDITVGERNEILEGIMEDLEQMAVTVPIQGLPDTGADVDSARIREFAETTRIMGLLQEGADGIAEEYTTQQISISIHLANTDINLPVAG